MRLALVMILVATTASADDDGAITGFEAKGAGELRGRAVGADGKPLRKVEIHVTSKSGGEQIVKTDNDGNYKVVLKAAANETSMIFVRGHRGAHLGGGVAESVKVDGTEAIEIVETKPPTVPAKAVDPTIRILAYSDAAIKDDEWVRAWMTLDVDRAGVVRHLKWIHRPGHALDPIALRAAFDLELSPARDANDHPIASQVIWMFEWPSHSWLTTNHRGYDLTKLPDDYTKVACQKPGEHVRVRRDCAQADLTSALGETWIAKP